MQRVHFRKEDERVLRELLKKMKAQADAVCPANHNLPQNVCRVLTLHKFCEKMDTHAGMLSSSNPAMHPAACSAEHIAVCSSVTESSS